MAGPADLYVPWFAKGYVGVQLFFLLSGYLIFLTIERCPNYGDFLYRRWLRLFPAMLVSSGLILLSALSLYQRTEGLPGFYDALPGLTFIDPDWLRGLHLPVVGALEGDFWTLFTEVKFYVVFGAAFFLLGRRSVGVLIGLALLGAVVSAAEWSGVQWAASPVGRWLLFFHFAINAPCYGWFAAGALLYLYVDTRRRSFLATSAAMAVVGIFTADRGSDLTSLLCLGAVYGVFVAPLFFPVAARFFSGRFWVFAGFVSYPLYLLHENAGWALIRCLHGSFPWIPVLLVPLIPLLIVGTAAWLIAAFLEPLLRDLLTGGRAGGLRSAFSPSRLYACVAVGLLAAATAAVGVSGPVVQGRREFEARTLAADRAAAEPLEAALAQEEAALADVRRARVASEKALAEMRRP